MSLLYTTFHGSATDRELLQTALSHNCTCEIDPETHATTGQCAAHHMVLEQRILDGLLFERWLRARLEREEGL